MSAGNVDRIRAELEKAASKLPERFAGYHNAIIDCAIDCITMTAEHDDRKTNINQRFDTCLITIAKQMAAPVAEDTA